LLEIFTDEGIGTVIDAAVERSTDA
jgi:hypothetical protein